MLQNKRYRETVIAALEMVAYAHHSDLDADAVSVAERIAFFNETRHSFGRSALLLSGGATLGMYHTGVVKALYDQDLLPRVISGASAGSTIAALLAARTDEELEEIFEYENLNTRFFTQREKPGGAKEHKEHSGGGLDSLIAMLPPPLPMILHGVRRKFVKGYALDIRTLEASLRENCGEYTFQEAFDRTGRIVNIVVTPTASGRIPMVLNYLTSPHVFLWSAALASCAVPGVFEPVELRARGIEGGEIPYFPQGQKWSDGSVENDLPMQRLGELFNVNHFVVSQVNPHALFFAGTSLTNDGLSRMIQFLKAQLKSYIKNISLLSLQFGIPLLGKGPSFVIVIVTIVVAVFAITIVVSIICHHCRFFFDHCRRRPLLGKGLLPLLTQKYEGDITLVPRWGVNDLFELFKDPTKARFEACRLEGQRITWPAVEELTSECKACPPPPPHHHYFYPPIVTPWILLPHHLF
jgi:TAG lipase/steryl ester hydrolase/phospholipase A2/LPA acyltransferase